MSVSPQFNVRVLPNTVLGQAAINLAPYSYSSPISVPSLGQTVARLDPNNASGTGFPDTAGDTSVHGYGGVNGTRAWIWGSRFVWDSVTQRALGINSPHPGAALGDADNGYLTLLSMYDATSNQFVIMESPFGNSATWPRSVAHLFDNQCIAGRVLYKWTHPVFRSGQGFVQPQITKINLDALTTDMTSGRLGAAYLGSIPSSLDNNITAGALDYLPGCNCLITLHKSRLLIYDLTATQWLPEVPLGFPVQNAIHNLGHYHPQVGKFVCGGGSLVGSGALSDKWITVDGTTRTITPLDDSPVIMSVQEEGSTTKAASTYDPNSAESIVFHDNGSDYGLNSLRATGAQWRTIASGRAFEVDWCCAMSDYGCILVATSATGGGATIRLYRGA